jgi:hypothetical protein
MTDDRLSIKYVNLDEISKWSRNPKLHDVGAIVQSIRKYGFKDPPKFEPELNDGRGGLVEGNGRDEALLQMKQGGESAPRGIEVDDAGNWFVPILFGVDAESRQAAEAYGVDHNNITLMGGNFTTFDLAKMWDMKSYDAVLLDLTQLDEFTVSVPETVVEDYLITSMMNNGTNQVGEVQKDEVGQKSLPNEDYVQFRFGVYKALVSKQVYNQFITAYNQIKKEKAGAVMMDDVLQEWLGVDNAKPI